MNNFPLRLKTLSSAHLTLHAIPDKDIVRVRLFL
jgi:hypothetical protein